MDKHRSVELVSLDKLIPGESGVVARLKSCDRFNRRLTELGFTKGIRVFVDRTAPLNDPVEYVIRNYHVSLRRIEAANVLLYPKSIRNSQYTYGPMRKHKRGKKRRRMRWLIRNIFKK